MENDIQVSIICNAYNHEAYIRDALDGFVMQKTDFKYEVLIHDDASTDRTADIIREYEKRYPDIVKPVYQTENQYSKDSGIVGRIQMARVKGKYIAVCEGDDYWTDPLKLQKQFNAMENHPELDICAHASRCRYGDVLKEYVKPSEYDTVFPIERVIMENGFDFVSTASLFYRADINKNMPVYRKNFNIDYALQVHGSTRGGMLYLSDCMAVYRRFTSSSWSKRMSENRYLHIRFKEKAVKLYDDIDSELGGKYHSLLKKRADDSIVKIMIFIYCNRPELTEEYNLKYGRRLGMAEQIKIWYVYTGHRIKKLLRGLKSNER